MGRLDSSIIPGMQAALLCWLLLLSASCVSQPQVPLPEVKNRIAVVAHRGGAAVAPENTLAAIRSAVKLRADYVEIDVRASRDNQLVLMHDSTVDRTTDGAGAVDQLDLATIRGLDAGAGFSPNYRGERVPTLDEALQLCRGDISIYLDHKDGPVGAIVDAIRKRGMERHVVVYGSVEDLLEWKRLAPSIPVMPSLPASYRREGGVAEFHTLLAAEALDGHLSEWSKELVDQAHAEGIEVYVDCMGACDGPEGYRKAVQMGVDGIQTDHPDKLLKFLLNSLNR